MSELVDHAKRELELAGEDPEFAEHIIKVVQAFSEYGHSGSTAMFAIDVITKLLQFKPLTPLTYEPEEWVRHEGYGIDGGSLWQNRRDRSLWQNKRDRRIFSYDGGKTHYNIEDV